MADSRTGKNNRHTPTAQFRQSVFGRLAGYEDVNDADRLGYDPAMRWIDEVHHARRPTDVVVLDMDSSVSPTHGEQEGTGSLPYAETGGYIPIVDPD
ncbi:transposase (fragment) [Magnetospirillum molischianum DSM 120]|uniref:Transposase n=1 Tax=Magnetospirillum molischianum DSM 120 TaxID=1150626 RepID=H8FPA1_MAGML